MYYPSNSLEGLRKKQQQQNVGTAGVLAKIWNA
jgi:hypothetical protein